MHFCGVFCILGTSVIAHTSIDNSILRLKLNDKNVDLKMVYLYFQGRKKGNVKNWLTYLIVQMCQLPSLIFLVRRGNCQIFLFVAAESDSMLIDILSGIKQSKFTNFYSLFDLELDLGTSRIDVNWRPIQSGVKIEILQLNIQRCLWTA